MNDRLAQAEALFHEVLELPPEQREGFLQQACVADAELLREVTALLRASGVADHWLKDADCGVVNPSNESSLPDSISEGPGTVIGRYKLLEKIGEGGFGVVYMAEQEVPVRRKVALKIIKLGMDTRSVIARFEAERQALAMMDHPNIAKVLDAGATDTGRPYFVMELVRGAPMTKFCEENRLSTKERLELFMKVCGAIQHAHQKGIIHRDIKPTNVLVTNNDGVPFPMVIDFGVAKAINQRLTEKTLFTNFAQMIGTPAYMSPEQAEMSKLDVDTRSDVYSLGVLLYELLTGTTPFPEERLRSAGYAEMQRIISEEEPLKPSTRFSTMSNEDRASIAQQRKVDPARLGLLIRGDLDWMVMKSLEKDRTRRYDTASAVALDIQRHLNNEPILARPPSNVYRFQKLVRRNRAAFTAAAMTLAALLIGFGATTWSLVRERAARTETEQRRKEAEEARFGEQRELRRAEAAVTKLEIERAELLFDAGNSSHALAYLARILRREPKNQVVAERLMSALSQRNFCLPAIRSLRHESSAKHWRQYGIQDYGALPGALREEGSICSAQFSPDGKRIVTASKDKTAVIWDASTGQRLLPPLQHDAEVLSANFSWDGKRIVTASLDTTARIWDAVTGQRLPPPLKHGAGVVVAEFSPDGERVITGSIDKTARLWNSRTGEPLTGPLQHSNVVISARFSPDGKWIATASDNMALIWDGWTGAPQARPLNDGNKVFFAEFSADGKKIVTGGYSWLLKVWDVETGAMIFQQDDHQETIRFAQFSPDGKRLVSAGHENLARLRDAHTGKTLMELKHDDAVLKVEFSADGHRLVTASKDRTARVWNAHTGKPLTEPLRHDAPLVSARFSPDGQRLVTVVEDNVAWLWDIRCVSPGIELQTGGRVNVARFSPDGQRVITGSADNSLRVWDSRSGKELIPPLRHPKHVQWAAFSPDGKRVITTAFGTTRVFDAYTGEPITEPIKFGRAGSIARFGPDGQWFMAALSLQSLGIWNVNTTQLVSQIHHEPEVTGGAFSSDGKRVVTASKDKTARIWDALTGHSVGKPIEHHDEVSSGDFSPDGAFLVTASKDKTARISSATTGQLLFELKHDGAVQAAVFSPDGERVLTRCGNAARVWNARTGQAITEPLKHSGRINSALFSPDGRRVITASDDDTARIWDSETGHSVSEPLKDSGLISYAEFGPDGRWVVTASDNHKARIWEFRMAALPIPPWLAELAEAAAGQRFNERNESEPVSTENFFTLKQSLVQNAASSDYVRWAEWFLNSSDDRKISPSAETTGAQQVEAYLEQKKIDSLRRALTLFPTNATVLARLAQLLASDTVGSAAEWNLLLRRAIKFGPTDVRVWTAIAEMLQNSDIVPDVLAQFDVMLKAQSHNPAVWRVQGLLLEKQQKWEQAYAAFSKAIELAANTNSFPPGARAATLFNRSRVLKQFKGPAEAQAEFLAAKGFPQRSPQAGPNLIDLSPYYNQSLVEDHRGRPGGFQNTFPTGLQSFNGVGFDVRGVIQLVLSEPGLLPFPEQVEIGIRRPCARIHFLHGAHNSVAEGILIGSYRVRYADGQIQQVPIVYAEDLREWATECDCAEPHRARLVWKGKPSGYVSNRLYHRTWENPHPELSIESIDFISTRTKCGPFLIALTVE